MLTPTSPAAFTDALADILRLSPTTLATTHLYAARYARFYKTAPDAPINPLDPYTLSLATLSLATKTTSTTRRLSKILHTAHCLLHPEGPGLKIPSSKYDTLRATLVHAELLLLRVLGFETRLVTPVGWAERYLRRVFRDIMEEQEWPDEEEEDIRDGEGGKEEGRLAAQTTTRAVDACKSYTLANFYPPRAVAVGCVYLALEERGLSVRDEGNVRMWMEGVTGGKVDWVDFGEVLGILREEYRGRLRGPEV